MYYAQDSIPAISGIKAWDACATLGIINPDRGTFTCVGYAPSQRRRCRNPINQYNRGSAYDLLDRISNLSPTSKEVAGLLPQLASYSLCARFHQNQVHSMTQTWAMKISQLSQPIYPQKSTPQEQGMPKRYQAGYESYSFHAYASQTRTKSQPFNHYFYNVGGQTRYRNEERKQQQQHDEYRFKQEEDDSDYEEEKWKGKWRKEREEKEKEKEREQREQEKARKRREEEQQRKKHEEEKNRKKQAEEAERKKQEEEKERRKREDEARERTRQKAQQEREERERQAMRDRREWQQAWQTYMSRWATFRNSDTNPSNLLEAQKAIPWPTKTGCLRDVNRSNVMSFYRNACPDAGTPAMSKTMRAESLKWHPDKMSKLYPACTPTVGDREVVLMICQVVLELKEQADAMKGD